MLTPLRLLASLLLLLVCDISGLSAVASVFAVQLLLFRDVPSISEVAVVPSVASTHVAASVPVDGRPFCR